MTGCLRCHSVTAHEPRRLRRCGFTLVEMIATMVILATLGSVSSMIILRASDGYLDARVGSQLQAEASVALDRLVREMRNVDLDTGAGGIAPNIDNVTATSMTWNDSWAIELVGDELRLTDDGAPPAVLLDDVSTFEIRMYDESNSAMAQSLSGAACDPIRRIELTLAVTRSGITQTLRTRVYLRATITGAGS